jgi:hypothetical protein
MVDDGLGIQVEVIEGDDLIEVVTKVRTVRNDRIRREHDGLYSIELEDGSADKQTSDLIEEFEKIRNG